MSGLAVIVNAELLEEPVNAEAALLGPVALDLALHGPGEHPDTLGEVLDLVSGSPLKDAAELLSVSGLPCGTPDLVLDVLNEVVRVGHLLAIDR